MIGRTLSHFEITASLGEGGMGEVYRASDTKLGREVAIKVLPEAFTADTERLARFEREARLLASLSHTNIAGIYEVGEQENFHFLVMELAEGETLAKRIARGPIPRDEALAIALQIATGLEAAHERGIIHRDLKPANVMLTPDREIKILDFGLAKAMADDGDSPGSSPDLTQSPTVAAQMTGTGVLLGTPAYMSPEQAQGEAVDKRADIWAFGVVCWEMLVGEPLFTGSSFSETLLAVLSREPDWSRLPAETPDAVRRLLVRCLRRDPRERLRDVGEARIRLQGGEPTDDATPTGLDRRWLRRTARLGVGLGVLLAIGAFLIGRSFGPVHPAAGSKPPLLLDLELEGFTLVGQGEAYDGPKISPDGRQILYPTVDELRIRVLTELEAVTLPGTEDASYLFWSADSRSIAYARGGRLWKKPTDGGPSTDLGPHPPDLFGSGGGAWNAAGRLTLAGSSEVGLVGFSADGRELGELLPLAEGEADFHEVSALPGDRGFLFTVHGPDGVDTIAALLGGGRRDLLRLPGESLAYPSYLPTGHLVYERETTSPGLWAVRFSLESNEVVGAPFLAIPDASMPSQADDGTLVFVRREYEPAELVKVGRDGLVQSLTRLSAPARLGSPGWLDLSPDGRRVALPLDAPPYGDLWLVDLERGTQTRLDEGWVGSVRPLWMPDGSRLIYASLRGSRTTWKTWIASAEGTEEPRKLHLAGADVVFPLAVSPDGEWLIFAPSGAELEFFAIRMTDPAERLTIAHSGGRGPTPTADFSPDGKWLAYQTSERGSPAVWLQPFPPDGRRWPVSTDRGLQPRWSSSGTELYYRSGARMMVVAFEPGPEPTVSRPVELFNLPADSDLFRDFEPLPDGEGFLMVRSRSRHRVTLVFDLEALLAEAEAAQRASS